MGSSLDAGLAPLLLILVLVLALVGLLPRRQPPTIMYVPLDYYQEPAGLGCLPLLLLGGVLLVLLAAMGQ